MASSKEIRISIVSALNAAGIEATKRQVNDMAKSVGGSLSQLANTNKTHMADIKAGWDLTCGAIQKAWAAVTAGLKSAFHFETHTTQFKTLIGDIDEARRHMKDLKELGDTPPFSLDQFAAASRQLMVMTDGVLGYKRSLEMVGDAAAATGVPIEQMGHAVGRLYAFIRDGQPLSRAVMELRNMGVITPEVAQSLQDLQAAGASNADIWAEVEKQLGRYNGAMAETEKTGEGMIGAIQSRWDNVVRAFGKAFENTAKGGLQSLLDKMKELEEGGTLEVWAAKLGAALSKAVEAVKVAVGWGQKLMDAYHWVQDKGEALGSYVGTMVGAMSEGASVSEAGAMAGKAYVDTERETKDRRREEKAAEETIRKEATAKREAAKAAEESARADKEHARIAEQLAAKQKAQEEAARVKEREKEKKEGDKLWKEVYTEELADAVKREADARNEAAKAVADVKSAEDKLKAAIQTYEDNLAQNKTNELVVDSAFKGAAKGGMYSGHADFLKASGGIAKEAATVATDRALAEGKIRTVAEYDKSFKQADREARIANAKQATKEGMDAQAAARIAAKSEKARSKQEQDFLDKWKKVNAANKKQKEDIQKAKEELEKAKDRKQKLEQAQIDAATDINDIKRMLNNLGLK